MADIFLSYSREDSARADHIARSLQAQGLDVFWDSEIPPGQTWADYIEAKLTACKVLVVLWSSHSVGSQHVREEARIGRDKSKMIPVLIESVSVPLGFGEVQAANLVNWNGDPNQPDWRRLVGAVCAAAGVSPRPQPAFSAPPPPSRFTPPIVQMMQSSGDAAKPSPGDYIRKCFALYVDGKGRARRAEYWWWLLFTLVLVIAAAVLDVALFGINPMTQAASTPLFTGIVGLGLVCPSVSVGVRRLHDIGVSGWLFVPIAIGYFFLIGALVMLIVALMPSKPEANQYGPNPKLASAGAI